MWGFPDISNAGAEVRLIMCVKKEPRLTQQQERSYKHQQLFLIMLRRGEKNKKCTLQMEKWSLLTRLQLYLQTLHCAETPKWTHKKTNGENKGEEEENEWGPTIAQTNTQNNSAAYTINKIKS